MNNAFKLLRESIMERTGDCASNEEEGYVRFNIEGKQFLHETTIVVSHGLMAMFVVFPFKLPKKRLRAVAEFFMRINGGIPIGSFHVNFKEAKASFYIAIPRDENNITKEQMTDTVHMMLNQSMMPINRMSKSFINVAWKNMSPATAVQMMSEQPVLNVPRVQPELMDIEAINQN